MTILARMVAAQGGPRITLTGGSFADFALNPFNATVQYVLSSAGVESYSTANSGGGTIGNWVTPTAAAGAAYDVRATLVSGTAPSGTLGSWLSLGSSRAWELVQSAIGTATCQLTVEIRLASSGTVLASKTVDLSATKSL